MALVTMSDIQNNRNSSTPDSGLVPMSKITSSSGLIPMSQIIATSKPVQDPVPTPTQSNVNFNNSTNMDKVIRGNEFISNPDPFAPFVQASEKERQSNPVKSDELPGGMLNPINDWVNLNKAFDNTGVGKFINESVHSAGSMLGLNDDQMAPNTPTGSKLADTIANLLGVPLSFVAPNMGSTSTASQSSELASNLAESKIGQKVMNAAGEAVNPLLNLQGINLAENTAQKVGQSFAKGATTGAVFGAAAPFAYGQGNISDVPNSIIDNALMFGAGDAVLPLAGSGFKKIVQPVVDRNDFKKAIDEYIQRTQAPNQGDIPPGYQTLTNDRIVQQQPSAAVSSKGDEFAANFNRGGADPQVKDDVQANVARKSLPRLDDNFLMPLTHYADTLYRETSPEDALKMIPGSNTYVDISSDHVYFSNNKDLAIGQGKNKGVIIEMESKGIQGQVNREKPSWEMSYKNGDAEFIGKYTNQHAYQNAVKSVTIKPDATVDKVTQARLKRTLSEWEKVKNPDGSVTFLRPGEKPANNLTSMQDVQKLTARASKEPITLETAVAKENVQNYAGNAMPFRQAVGQTDRTINRNQVIRNMRKNLGLTIDTGRLGSGMKNVLGIFKTTPEVIRSGMAEDIQTLSHEAGHAFDKKFKLQDPRFQGELDQLMQSTGHNMAAYQPNQLLGEGVAEFVRLYLTDRAEALKQAPNFAKYFESKISTRALNGIEKTTRDIDTWITQGPINQAKGLIDFESHKGKPNPFSWNKWYTNQIDDLNPFKLAEKALTGKVGFGKDSIYKMARNTRGIAERAKLAVTDGIYIGGKKVSEGLREIVKTIEEAGFKEKDIATYLDVKQALDLKAMGKRVPFTDQHITAVMNEYDKNPVMSLAQQKIIKWQNALLDIAVDGELKSQKTVDYLREKYPNYVPFDRHFEEDMEAGFKNGGFGAAKAFANITDPIKRMSEEGSYRTLINPIESMVKNAFLIMNAAAKNKVGLQLADLSKIDGAGAWVEHVPGASSPHEHVVTVWENGEKQAYKIREPELYKALLTLDHESSIGIIRFLGGAAGMLRAGSTLTPEFMARNAARDMLEAFVKVGFHPVDFARGLVHVLGKTDTFNHFLSEGGAMGTMMALDRESLQRDAMSKVFRESLKDKALNVVTSPKELTKLLTGITPAKKVIGALRHGAEVSELATKVGTFAKVLDKTGSAEEAAFTARDLMDFNRAGSNVRQTNRIVAFLNSSLQGTDGMIRAFKQNPSGFLVKAAVGLILPTIANYYANQNLSPENKQIFDNIPQWQKDSYLIVHVPGTDKFARIPKPFELGTLFSTGTERILRALDGHDPEAFKNYGTALLQAMTPPIMISLFTPLLEATTNYSFFRKGPIVTQTYDRYEKKDQYDPIKTSETAKAIGRGTAAIGLDKSNASSPLIIDNTIRGYTGGLGQYAVSGLDKVLEHFGVGGHVTKPAKNWDETSLAQPFFVNTSGGGQIRQDFYSKWNDLAAAKASATRNEEPFNDPTYERMNNAKSYIDSGMKQYKVIQSDPNMNSKEKRSKLDQLDAMMNQAAAQGLGK